MAKPAPQFEYEFVPQGETLRAYYESWNRVNLIIGPLGSAKTSTSCMKLFNRVINHAPNAQKVRRSRWLVIRNTYRDLLSTTVEDWRNLFDDLGPFKAASSEPPTHALDFRLADGTSVRSDVVFLACDRPDSVRRLRGFQATGVYLSEAKELAFPIVSMADLRHGRFPDDETRFQSWSGMIGDSNAPDEDEWLYRLAEEERPALWSFFKQPGGVIKTEAGQWVMNPKAENLANLKPGYYENGVIGKADDWIKVNLGNEYGYVQDGKPVYPEFRDSMHVRECGVLPGLGLYIGLDFGLTPAATIAQRAVNGQWRVLSECVATDMGVKRFAGELRRHLAEHYAGMTVVAITGDPAGQARGDDELTTFQILKAEKVDASPAPTNEFTKRREAVAATMTRLIDGEPGLLVHPRCKMLRKALAGRYCFRRVQLVGTERYHDEPDKNAWSHVAEAQQYMMLGGGEHRLLVRPPSGEKIGAGRPGYAIM